METPLIHIDMDAFFAAVEELDFPHLRGKPIMVGGAHNRGVVSTANYEARKYGVRSAMSGSEARRRCPQGVFVEPRFSRYVEISRQVMDIFRAFTPLVEPMSLDEAYLDLRPNTLELEDPWECATLLKNEIFSRTGLTASAGLAPNKFLAKMASEQNKPNGLTQILPHDVERFLSPLLVRKIPGVGPSTEAKLREKGMITIEDIRNYPKGLLLQQFGSWGQTLLDRAWGKDSRTLSTEHIRKSVGAERTFAKDRIATREIQNALTELCHTLSTRMEKRDLYARTLTLKVRYNTFETRTHQGALPRPTRDPFELESFARGLLSKTDIGLLPIRLLGLSASHFEAPSIDAVQLSFPLEAFLC